MPRGRRSSHPRLSGGTRLHSGSKWCGAAARPRRLGLSGGFDDALLRNNCSRPARSEASVKTILLGESGVGKTALATRFCTGAYDPLYKAPIGVDFFVERFEILGKPFKLHMSGRDAQFNAYACRWDTAGQERFRSMAESYYRHCSGAALQRCWHVMRRSGGGGIRHGPSRDAGQGPVWRRDVRPASHAQVLDGGGQGGQSGGRV